MKKLLLLFCLIVSFSCADKIGFKGIYLEDTFDNGCKVLKNLMPEIEKDKKTKYKLIKTKNVCVIKWVFELAGDKIDFNYVGFSTKNNKIHGILYSKEFVNRFFNASQITVDTFAQLIVDKVSWINTLNVIKRQYYGYTDTKQGWKIKLLATKEISLEKIATVSFN